jgi:hypothetical protein
MRAGSRAEISIPDLPNTMQQCYPLNRYRTHELGTEKSGCQICVTEGLMVMSVTLHSVLMRLTSVFEWMNLHDWEAAGNQKY